MQYTHSKQLNIKGLGIDAELFLLPVETGRTSDPQTASEVKLF